METPKHVENIQKCVHLIFDIAPSRVQLDIVQMILEFTPVKYFDTRLKIWVNGILTPMCKNKGVWFLEDNGATHLLVKQNNTYFVHFDNNIMYKLVLNDETC